MILSEMYKKILVVLVFVALLVQSLALPTAALANTRWWAPTLDEFSNKVSGAPPGEIFGERYTHAQVFWIIYTIFLFFTDPRMSQCVAINNVVDGILNCLGIPPDTIADASNSQNASTYTPGGILAFAALSDYMLAKRPASGVQYVATKLQDLGIPTAYAQEGGFGFNTLAPIQTLWAATRNAAYALMTLAVVLLAFMIMFRTRISPQASVSVMTAIPRVIIGLLLITFSFAIAGFIIDLTYVALGIVAALFSGAGLFRDGASLTAVEVFNAMNDAGGGLVAMAAAIFLMFLAPALIAGAVTGGVLGLTLGPLGGASGLALGALALLIIVLIVLIIAILRIFWILLRTYLMIILLVIALPFGALGYVASTGTNPFTILLRSLVAQMSVFVTIIISIMLGHVIFWGFGAALPLSTIQFMNPYHVRVFYDSGLAGFGFPGFSGANPSLLGVFLGIMTLLTGPSLATNVRQWIATGRFTGGTGFGPTLPPFALGGRVAGQNIVTSIDKKVAAATTMTPQLRFLQGIATIIRGASGGRMR